MGFMRDEIIVFTKAIWAAALDCEIEILESVPQIDEIQATVTGCIEMSVGK